MKTIYVSLALLLAVLLTPPTAGAQVLAPNQNPSFALSRDKYMRLADSLTRWHSTTFQDTYAAPDWYEQRLQRRQDRRDLRRELRLYRAQHYGGYSRYNWYEPYYPYDGYFRYRPYHPFWFGHR